MVDGGNLPIDPNRQVAPSETSQQSVNHGIKLTEIRVTLTETKANEKPWSLPRKREGS